MSNVKNQCVRIVGSPTKSDLESILEGGCAGLLVLDHCFDLKVVESIHLPTTRSISLRVDQTTSAESTRCHAFISALFGKMKEHRSPSTLHITFNRHSAPALEDWRMLWRTVSELHVQDFSAVPSQWLVMSMIPHTLDQLTWPMLDRLSIEWMFGNQITVLYAELLARAIVMTARPLSWLNVRSRTQTRTLGATQALQSHAAASVSESDSYVRLYRQYAGGSRLVPLKRPFPSTTNVTKAAAAATSAKPMSTDPDEGFVRPLPRPPRNVQSNILRLVMGEDLPEPTILKSPVDESETVRSPAAAAASPTGVVAGSVAAVAAEAAMAHRAKLQHAPKTTLYEAAVESKYVTAMLESFDIRISRPLNGGIRVFDRNIAPQRWALVSQHVKPVPRTMVVATRTSPKVGTDTAAAAAAPKAEQTSVVAHQTTAMANLGYVMSAAAAPARVALFQDTVAHVIGELQIPVLRDESNAKYTELDEEEAYAPKAFLPSAKGTPVRSLTKEDHHLIHEASRRLISEAPSPGASPKASSVDVAMMTAASPGGCDVPVVVKTTRFGDTALKSVSNPWMLFLNELSATADITARTRTATAKAVDTTRYTFAPDVVGSATCITASIVSPLIPLDTAFRYDMLTSMPISVLAKHAMMDALARAIVELHATTNRSHNDFHTKNAMFNSTTGKAILLDFALSTTVAEDATIFDVPTLECVTTSDARINGRLFDVLFMTRHLLNLEGMQYEADRAVTDATSYARLFLKCCRTCFAERKWTELVDALDSNRLRMIGEGAHAFKAYVTKIATERVRSALAAHFDHQQLTYRAPPMVFPPSTRFFGPSVLSRATTEVTRLMRSLDMLGLDLPKTAHRVLYSSSHSDSWVRNYLKSEISLDAIEKPRRLDEVKTDGAFQTTDESCAAWMKSAAEENRHDPWTLIHHSPTQTIDCPPPFIEKKHPAPVWSVPHLATSHPGARFYITTLTPKPASRDRDDTRWRSSTQWEEFAAVNERTRPKGGVRPAAGTKEEHSVQQFWAMIDAATVWSGGRCCIYSDPILGTGHTAFGALVADIKWLCAMQGKEGFEQLVKVVRQAPEPNAVLSKVYAIHTAAYRMHSFLDFYQRITHGHDGSGSEDEPFVQLSTGYEHYLAMALIHLIRTMHASGVAHGNLKLEHVMFDPVTHRFTIVRGDSSICLFMNRKVCQHAANHAADDHDLYMLRNLGAAFMDYFSLYADLMAYGLTAMAELILAAAPIRPSNFYTHPKQFLDAHYPKWKDFPIAAARVVVKWSKLFYTHAAEYEAMLLGAMVLHRLNDKLDPSP